MQTATAVPQEYATYATHSVSLIPQPEPQTLMMPQSSQQILTANTSSAGGGKSRLIMHIYNTTNS